MVFFYFLRIKVEKIMIILGCVFRFRFYLCRLCINFVRFFLKFWDLILGYSIKFFLIIRVLIIGKLRVIYSSVFLFCFCYWLNGKGERVYGIEMYFRVGLEFGE